MELIVNAGAICYGMLLIMSQFVRNRITEALRVDALLLPNPTDRTRPLNALLGLLVAGYGAWSLWYHLAAPGGA
ncbi:MAG: hypothetical protein AB1735_08495 [Pseudomonadota bacterium]|jgi:hypothetical protein